MSGLPDGPWSPLLVGRQWPYDTAVTAMNTGANNRGGIETGYHDLADNLRAARTGPLAEQKGRTADDMSEKLNQGEDYARRVATKNSTKKDTYNTAHNNAESLQSELSELAEEGNEKIDHIQRSDKPTADKVGEIASVIADCQRQANQKAAKYGANIIDAIQRVLDEEGNGQSAHDFTNSSSLYPQPDPKAIEDQVRGVLDNPGSTLVGAPNDSRPQEGQPHTPSAMPAPGGTIAGTPNNFQPGQGQPPAPATALPPAPGRAIAGSPSKFQPGQGQGQLAAAPAVARTPAAPAPAASAGGLQSAAAAPSVPNAPSPPNAGAPAALAGSSSAPTAGSAQGLASNSSIPSFGQGSHAGAPLSSSTNAVPSAPTTGTSAQADPQAPPSASTSPMAGSGAAVSAHAFDTPSPAERAPATTPLSPPLAATPAPPAAAASVAAASVASSSPPAGPLPAYGADLRPPVSAASTPSAPLSPMPLSAASAPMSTYPGAGQPGLGQTPVMRQTPLSALSQPSSVGAQTAMVAAGGALVGAASAGATNRARLQRLVDSVARQQRQLAWAAGDRPDGATVLVTDLACGWIPPGIDLPAAVTLLDPAFRYNDLIALVGEVSLSASYQPGHYIPGDDEPVPTSPRPRHTPDIEEFGWDLSRATHWRDGLPRIAHTVAMAAARQTGVLESEADELREELVKAADKVLDTYADDIVDTDDVGNWQLLAAIDALVGGDKTIANYHLSWFLACTAVQT
jgi:hypothetical protein